MKTIPGMEGMDDILEQARRDLKHIKESSGGNRNQWAIYGKNAQIPPGGTGVYRIAPSSNIKAKFVMDGGVKKLRPGWKPKPLYVQAFEHWFDDAEGRRAQVWCTKTFEGQTARCPVCEMVTELSRSGDPKEAEAAKEMSAKEIFIWNAYFGPMGERTLTEEGVADIRQLHLQGNLSGFLLDFLLGGGKEAYQKNFADPVKGRDLIFERPPANKQGGRWKIQMAPNDTPLFTAEERDAFKGWADRIPDLQALLDKERRTYEFIYKKLHGSDPDPEADPVNAAADAEDESIVTGLDDEGDETADDADGLDVSEEEIEALGAELGTDEDEEETPPAPPPARKLPPPAKRPTAGRR